MTKLFTAIFDDARLLKHFLAHYKNAGVSEFFVAVSPEIRETVTAFSQDYNITIYDCFDVGDAVSGRVAAMTAMRRRHQQPHEWVLVVDFDELIEFPQPSAAIIGEAESEKANVVAGVIYDRFTADGSPADLSAVANLDEIFPIKARFTKNVMRGSDRKAVLVKGLLKSRPVHHFFPNETPSSRVLSISRYRWTDRAVERLQSTIETLAATEKGAWVEYQRALDHYRRHGCFAWWTFGGEPASGADCAALAYDGARAAQRRRVAGELDRLDAEMRRATGEAGAGPQRSAFLRAKQRVLRSGLFDAEYYLETNADLRGCGSDPLDHYIRQGEREGRQPNPLFSPAYYRRRAMAGMDAAENALADYAEQGERDGQLPSPGFSPRAYLAANPGLAAFVDRPLFHFLQIGKPAGLALRRFADSSARDVPGCAWAEAFVREGWQAPHLLMKFKQALARELGVSRAFALYREILPLPDSERIVAKPLVSQFEFAKAHALSFVETAPAGERFPIAAPRVVGEGEARARGGTARCAYVAQLADARVRNRSSVIEVDDVALLDFQGGELNRHADDLEYDDAIFQATKEKAWIVEPASGRSPLELDTAITLLGQDTDSFGDWVWTHLPKYILAVASGAMPPVPVLIDAEMPASHRQALELLLADGAEIVEVPSHTPVRVRRLWCVPGPAYQPVYRSLDGDFDWAQLTPPSARVAPLFREMTRRISGRLRSAAGPARIFLARRGSRYRRLVNHWAIEAEAAARGFTILYPEDFDFLTQVWLIRSARFVVMPEGSAAALTCFVEAGLKLCILSHPWIGYVQSATDTMSALGIDVTVVTGPVVRSHGEFPERADYRIPEDRFAAFLDQWLESDQASPPARRSAPAAQLRHAPTRSDEPQRVADAGRRPKATPAEPARRQTSAAPLPLVSIVYLTYNHEKFAREAVRSVLDQTYPNLEIIILDDFSSDATAQVIRREVAKSERQPPVKLVRNPRNLGESDNTRQGLAMARGDFVILFNGDDVMLPQMAAEMVETWQRTGVSLVSVNAELIDGNGASLNRYWRDPQEPFDESFATLVRDGSNAVCFGAGMGFERQVYEKFGWPAPYFTAEDIMVPFYAYLCNGARFIPKPLIRYRVHQHNASMTLQWERAATAIEKLLIQAEDAYIHIAHAVAMTAQIERQAASRSIDSEILKTARPLLTVQVVEMSKKLVAARRELFLRGVKNFHRPLLAQYHERPNFKLFVAICNDARLLEPFLQHYSQVGVTEFYLAVAKQYVSTVEKLSDRYVITCYSDLDVVDSLYGGTAAVTEMRRRHQGEGEWVIVVDLDEFVEFGDRLPAIVKAAEAAGANVVRGILYDRFAENGLPADFRPGEPLSQVFPVKWNFTKEIMGGTDFKGVLVRGPLKTVPASSHHGFQGEKVFTEPVEISHYKWIATALARVRSAYEFLVKHGIPWAHEYKKVLDHFEHYGRFAWDRFGGELTGRPDADGVGAPPPKAGAAAASVLRSDLPA